MESSLLEIVELPNGDVVLQRADGEGEPLITLSFSDEAKAYMPNVHVEIAKAMIHAGVQAFSELMSQYGEAVFEDEEFVEEYTLH